MNTEIHLKIDSVNLKEEQYIKAQIWLTQKRRLWQPTPASI